MEWNYGDILDGVDAIMPADAPALVHGSRVVGWADFAARSNRVARALRERGAATGDKIGFYLRNCPEYSETLAAAFKARLVHVNVNFRYLDDELAYILENSDATVVVYGEEFVDRVDRVRGRLPGVLQWVQVGGDAPDWATSYEELASDGDPSPLGIQRSGDDLLFIYTGGTTGMPKGVMWRHDDLWGALRYGASMPCNGGQAVADLDTLLANIRAYGPGGGQVPACPLMHGTGLFTALNALACGTAIITLAAPGFDAEELWDAVDRNRATSVVIVGDAFAKPMLDALERNPGRWDIASIGLMVSSGVMWSRETKTGLLRHHPGMILFDSFGSSEAVGFGSSITTSEGETTTARFQIGEQCKVFTEDHLGRGSVCINTAGEKVFPEEVEEALKTHDDVVDALVVGLADDKWGQAVTAVVELAQGRALDEDALRGWVRQRLAGYKTPKRIVAIDRMLRAPNGKADYKGATDYARRLLG
jgi:acyl-CoA synthetase (AMP-forming)/AMP-acid ligase II